jgi:hypothetical protein
MKTYLVKIDRKSIKANEDAGRTHFQELIRTSVSVTIKGPHVSLEDLFPNNFKRQLWVTSTSTSEVLRADYVGYGLSSEIGPILEALVKDFKKNISYSLNNEYQDINLMTPVPSYSWSYIKTKVQCCHCNAKFTHDKLEDFYDEDSEGNFCGARNACPKCKQQDACELKFESFNEVTNAT